MKISIYNTPYTTSRLWLEELTHQETDHPDWNVLTKALDWLSIWGGADKNEIKEHELKMISWEFAIENSMAAMKLVSKFSSGIIVRNGK